MAMTCSLNRDPPLLRVKRSVGGSEFACSPRVPAPDPKKLMEAVNRFHREGGKARSRAGLKL